MNTQTIESSFDASRLGFALRIGAEELSEAALETLEPKLTLMGSEWVALDAPSGRAIPEGLIRGFTEAGLRPIIRIPLALGETINAEEFLYELKAYANWGVEYVSFFERPNLRASWPSAGWTQKGLVERFMEAFLPLAQVAMQAGLRPVLPAMEPGGDYWDTAFLRRMLEKLVQAEEEEVLAKLVIGAQVSGGHAIDWGAGGPEMWPEAVPYHTPEGSEDHRGFRIFDWYNTIMRATVERELPMLLFASGSASDVLAMAKRISLDTEGEASPLMSVPANVLGLIFDALSTDQDDWFSEAMKPNALGEEWISWRTGRKQMGVEEEVLEAEFIEPETSEAVPASQTVKKEEKHYVLLPTYSWGKAKFHTKVVEPFAKRHKPTIGYSLSQARKAERVTIVGGSHIFTDEIIEMLQGSGCEVEHVVGEAQEIAEQLARL